MFIPLIGAQCIILPQSLFKIWERHSDANRVRERTEFGRNSNETDFEANQLDYREVGWSSNPCFWRSFRPSESLGVGFALYSLS